MTEISDIIKRWRLAIHGAEQIKPAGYTARLEIPVEEMTLLADEIERLRGVLSEKPELKMVHFEDGTLDVVSSHPIAYVIIAELANMLDVSGTENFVAMTGRHPEKGDIEVLVRRCSGKAVATVLAERAMEIDRLRARVAELAAKLGVEP